MEQIIKKKIGDTVHTFVVTGEDLFDVVTESQKLSFPDVDKCGCCSSTDLTLGTHLGTDDKNKPAYKYVDIKCNSCKASLTFGRRKDNPDTFYLRKNDKNENDWKAFKTDSPAETRSTETKLKELNPQSGGSQKHQTKPVDNKPAANQGNQVNQVKPSGKAVNFGIKISGSKDRKSLDEICNRVKTMTDFSEIDLDYLRKECARKSNLLTQASAA